MSKSETSKNIVIIGNGISGITCARTLRKYSKHAITVISAETKFHYARTALMYLYMGQMRFEDSKPYEDAFWAKNNIQLLQEWVGGVDATKKEISLANGSVLKFDILVLAVGSKPNIFKWPGKQLKGVQGLYSYQDLVLMQEHTQHIQHAVIVGGGLIGVEMAEMLLSRGITVTFLVRESYFWNKVLPKEEAQLIGKHIQEHGVTLKFETELQEIVSDGKGAVAGVITSKGERINCSFVGLTVGVQPNIEWLKNSALNVDKGLLVNRYFETNLPNVYAIGDCAQFTEPLLGRTPIEQVWYTGRMHGETLGYSLAKGIKTIYNPGNWFNSAKFFEIEYQVYGHVPAAPTQGLHSFYWQHPSLAKSMRLVYEEHTQKFIGMHALGIRLRHAVIDGWLSDQKTIEYVMNHLSAANFDPEFYVRYEAEIQKAFK